MFIAHLCLKNKSGFWAIKVLKFFQTSLLGTFVRPHIQFFEIEFVFFPKLDYYTIYLNLLTQSLD
jgi:hypothetical protein